jgi:hypothetical protein
MVEGEGPPFGFRTTVSGKDPWTYRTGERRYWQTTMAVCHVAYSARAPHRLRPATRTDGVLYPANRGG